MKRIKQFITRCFNEEKNAYCWINTSKYLNPKELEDIKKYFDKKEYNFMLIINGCSELRPQRTYGTFPTFLKGIDGYHFILSSGLNAFILCSWLEDYDGYEEDIRELLTTIPDNLETIIFMKNR